MRTTADRKRKLSRKANVYVGNGKSVPEEKKTMDAEARPKILIFVTNKRQATQNEEITSEVI